MRQELLVGFVLALDVAGVAAVFVTCACTSLRRGRVVKHAGAGRFAAGVEGGIDGANRLPNYVLGQPEAG